MATFIPQFDQNGNDILFAYRLNVCFFCSPQIILENSLRNHKLIVIISQRNNFLAKKAST